MARKKTDKPAPPAPAAAPDVVVLELATAPLDCLQVVGLPLQATKGGHVVSVAPGDLVDTARRFDDKLAQWAKAHPAASLCYSIAASWVVGDPAGEVVVTFLQPPPSEA